jgi:hypothetical protein
MAENWLAERSLPVVIPLGVTPWPQMQQNSHNDVDIIITYN